MLIGIFGGSFNPIHNGHLAIAKQVLGRTKLNEIWFLVSPHNPLKKHDELMNDDLRLAMTQKALENEEGMKCSNYEFRLPRPSYMWNTLQSLNKDYPNDTFCLIIGADNWVDFHKWYKYNEILANYSIIIYPRKGFPIDKDNLPSNVSFVDMDLYNISSTEIRRMIENHEDISALTPKAVGDMLLKA